MEGESRLLCGGDVESSGGRTAGTGLDLRRFCKEVLDIPRCDESGAADLKLGREFGRINIRLQRNDGAGLGKWAATNP